MGVTWTIQHALQASSAFVLLFDMFWSSWLCFQPFQSHSQCYACPYACLMHQCGFWNHMTCLESGLVTWYPGVCIPSIAYCSRVFDDISTSNNSVRDLWVEFKSPVQSVFFAFFGRKPDWTALGSLGMVPGPLKDRSKVVATGFSKNWSKTSPKLVKTAKKPVCFAFYWCFHIKGVSYGI